jgi:hypothetical protein
MTHGFSPASAEELPMNEIVRSRDADTVLLVEAPPKIGLILVGE